MSKGLKETKKGSIEYQLINKALTFINDIAAINKEIKESNNLLDFAIQEKLLELTNDEIDMLIELKWFGSLRTTILDLVMNPLQSEIDKLDLLDKRYGQTIEDLDEEISKLEASFAMMMKDLVRTDE